MFGNIPDVVAGAGVMAVFAFILLGMMWHILKHQQTLITNHMSEGTKALVELITEIKENRTETHELRRAVERLTDKL